MPLPYSSSRDTPSLISPVSPSTGQVHAPMGYKEVYKLCKLACMPMVAREDALVASRRCATRCNGRIILRS